MLSKWPIRNKLLIGIGLLIVIVATLSASGFRGVYAYRSLARNLRGRAEELPLAATLSRQVSDLRVLVAELRTLQQAGASQVQPAVIDTTALGATFAQRLRDVRVTLDQYRDQLTGNNPDDSQINDSREEWQTVRKITAPLEQIAQAASGPDWTTDPARLETLQTQLDQLQALSWELPSFLHERIHNFADEVRTERRTLVILTWVTSVLATLLLGLFIRLFYGWVFRPLRVLIKGSRRVASGEFGYRIRLSTNDEMSELADSMNDMTARFEAIRDDLDQQVRERTKEVVRSEQLASVGFLAAGVAHEINNPLASIALCSESLEGRVQEVLDVAPSVSAEDRTVICSYLRMIQEEAFRCKGITERLLDFSRMGDVTKQHTDLAELVQGVIDMVGHLGRYQDKRLEFAPGQGVIAPVNAQEMKQVVLNLITNGLDSLSPGGVLKIELRKIDETKKQRGSVELLFTDNGCGMTEEVQKHLFEPFFTRNRCGQGTGLGLSITYRIVADHGGIIDAHSEGPGKGSQFRVSLPLTEQQKESDHRYQAA